MSLNSSYNGVDIYKQGYEQNGKIAVDDAYALFRKRYAFHLQQHTKHPLEIALEEVASQNLGLYALLFDHHRKVERENRLSTVREAHTPRFARQVRDFVIEMAQQAVNGDGATMPKIADTIKWQWMSVQSIDQYEKELKGIESLQ